MPPADLLQDLCSRFILNCPAEELQSFERILFLVEQARVHAIRAFCDVTVSQLSPFLDGRHTGSTRTSAARLHRGRRCGRSACASSQS